MGLWHISRHDGLSDGVEIGTLPGNMSEKEVSAILARLCCMTLSADVVLRSSLRSNCKLRTGLLDRVGSGFPIQFGHGETFFLANFAP